MRNRFTLQNDVPEFRIVNIYSYVSKVNRNFVFHMLIKHVEKALRHFLNARSAVVFHQQ